MRQNIHEHGYGAIGYFANDLQIAVGEDNGTGNVILGCSHDIGQGVVVLVVLARLYLYGQHMASVLYNKVEFALPLAVKPKSVIRKVPVRKGSQKWHHSLIPS